MKRNALKVAALGVALAVGCDREQASSQTGADAPAPMAENTKASGSSMPDLSRTTEEMKASAAEKLEQAKVAISEKTEQVKDAAADAQRAGEEKMAVLTAQAQKLFEQAATYVKENKWELADGTLKKLEAMKESLPVEWKTKIESLRKSLTAAKASLGNLPGLR